MSKLGRLQPIELHDIWPNEAVDFTPWLAKEENLNLLAETLGLELELEAQDRAVGDFRADILCLNTEDNSRVLIENQLGRTDHSHLGQILTYAAGLDIHTVIWIAKEFREEHRAALDRLNEITNEGFQYFGIEVKVWQIGDSARAPQFEIVSKPNDWNRTVRRNTEGAVNRNLSETQLLQKKFWEEFGQYLTNNNCRFSIPNPQPRAQTGFGIGKAGFTLYATLLVKARRIRIRLTIRRNNANVHFHRLKCQREEIVEELGDVLRWEELPDQESSWIALDKDNTDPTNEADWPNQREWIASKLELFYQIFRQRIHELDADNWELSEDENEI